VFCHRLQSGSQLISKVGRNTDRVPVKIGVPFMQPFALGFRKVCPSRKGLQAFDQKLMPFHLAEFNPGIEARRVPVERVGNRFIFVPVEGTERVDENSLPKVLTFCQAKLQLCNPLSFIRVWPLVTTVADDALLRCRMVAWLYSPDLGTFPAKSPLFSGCTWQLFSGSEKSLLCEVNDGHRT
jgi:hypothetical protein